jgi:hypothetical protein
VLSWPRRVERFLARSFFPAGWSLDDEWIYAYATQSRTVVRVSARTAKVEPVGSFPSGALGLYACDVAAGGRDIVCSLNETKPDAWMVEHFDPPGSSEVAVTFPIVYLSRGRRRAVAS